jgi:hypothetical protein
MVEMIDAAAIVAGVAGIQGKIVGGAPGRRQAIDRLGQGAGHVLQFLERVPRKKIGVGQAISFQAALEQLGDFGLFWKIGEHKKS